MCRPVRNFDILGWLEESEPTPWWSMNDVVKSIFWFVTVNYIKQALRNIQAPGQPYAIRVARRIISKIDENQHPPPRGKSD